MQALMYCSSLFWTRLRIFSCSLQQIQPASKDKTRQTSYKCALLTALTRDSFSVAVLELTVHKRCTKLKSATLLLPGESLYSPYGAVEEVSYPPLGFDRAPAYACPRHFTLGQATL